MRRSWRFLIKTRHAAVITQLYISVSGLPSSGFEPYFLVEACPTLAVCVTTNIKNKEAMTVYVWLVMPIQRIASKKMKQASTQPMTIKLTQASQKKPKAIVIVVSKICRRSTRLVNQI